jgi:hypothetical protein
VIVAATSASAALPGVPPVVQGGPAGPPPAVTTLDGVIGALGGALGRRSRR